MSILQNHERLSAQNKELAKVLLKDEDYFGHLQATLDENLNTTCDNSINLSLPCLVSSKRKAQLKELTVNIPRIIKSSVINRFNQSEQDKLDFFDYIPSDMLNDIWENTEHKNDISRLDLCFSENQFKCVEVNFGANLGGWQIASKVENFLHSDTCKSIKNHIGSDLVFPNPLYRFVEHIIECVLSNQHLEQERIHVVMSSLNSNMESSLQHFFETSCNSIFKHMDKRIKISCCNDFSQIKKNNDYLYLNNKRIDCIAQVSGTDYSKHIFETYQKGNVVWLNSPMSLIFNDKRNFSFLFDLEASRYMSVKDRELINTYVPWTALLKNQKIQFDGKKIELIPLIKFNKDMFVIKSATGSQGNEVLIGKFTEKTQWSNKIEELINSNSWIVQKYLPPEELYAFNSENKFVPHVTSWGIFNINGFAGGALRVLQSSLSKGIVNNSQGAKQMLIFEVKTK